MGNIKEGKTKYNLDVICKIAKEKEGECLSTQYINSRTKMNFRCKNNHEWQTEPRNILAGCWCPTCSNVMKHSIEMLQVKAKEYGGKCISTTYINSKTLVTMECKHGHKWDVVPRSIMSGHWCPECAQVKKLTLSYFKDLAISKQGKCLSMEYKNIKSKLNFECRLGHTWSSTAQNVKNGHWCPRCAHSKQI